MIDYKAEAATIKIDDCGCGDLKVMRNVKVEIKKDYVCATHQAIAALYRRGVAETWEEAAKVCEGLVTLTENHGCNCEPCAWCEALETAAAAIRTRKQEGR